MNDWLATTREQAAMNIESLQRRLDEEMGRSVRYESALRKIATPIRNDGTYNLGREACEQIAREALEAERSVPSDGEHAQKRESDAAKRGSHG